MPEEVSNSEEPEIAAELAHRIAAGDAAAETELVERYSRGLLFMLRRATGNPALADDLHQDTFRIVLERLRSKGLAQPERLAGFLRRTARNLHIAHVRKKTRRKTDGFDEAQPPTDPAPGQLRQALLAEEARLVHEILRELDTERDREVLHRFYILEEAKERICADLELSSLHFNRVLFRARQRFRTQLERARIGVRWQDRPRTSREANA